MLKIELRDHQKQLVDAVFKKFETDRFALAVLAVAGGKSYAAATVASKYKRVVVLQPSVELMKQNHASFEKLGIKNTMINGTYKGDWKADVIMTTAETLHRHLDDLEEPDLLIIDELHLQHWGKMRKTIMKAWQKCKVMGMTATPHYYVQSVRYKNNTMYSVTTCCAIADGYFGEPVFSLNREQMKELGYGADIEIKRVQIPRVTDQMFEYPEIYESAIIEHVRLVNELLKNCKNAIIYCDGIAHANQLAHSIKGVHTIFGNTKASERKEIIEKFVSGEIPYVATVGCLKIGFDKPDLENIVILSNVNNPSNAEQQIGRLNRGSGKKTCYYNGKLNTMDPVVGSERWVEIKRF